MSENKDKNFETVNEMNVKPHSVEDLKDVSNNKDVENEDFAKNQNQLEEDKSDEVNLVEEAPAEENLVEEVPAEEKSVEETLTEEIYILKDEKLRLLAEMENIRKRSERERLDLIKYGSINLARDILSPDDNLRRALEAIPQEEKNSETINNLIDGIKMIQREFSTILEKYGIKKIDALNKKFDYNFHQAMIEVESDEVESGTIVQEMQSGYTMHEKLLRPTMVGVSKKSIKNIEK